MTINNDVPAGKGAAMNGAPRTVAEALGQIVWVLSRSPAHREIRIKELEQTFLPAILHQQFRVFRFGALPDEGDPEAVELAKLGFTKQGLEQMPLGVAIWARLSAAAEAKLENGERLTIEEWKSGDRVWLVEHIVPFANKENRLIEATLMDLIKGPFADTAFSLHRTDITTGRREKVHMKSHLLANNRQ